jgi:hypothetical protein
VVAIQVRAKSGTQIAGRSCYDDGAIHRGVEATGRGCDSCLGD